MHLLCDSVKHSYSPEELRKCLRARDLWEFDIAESDLDTTIQVLSDDFFVSGCRVYPLKVSKFQDNQVFCPNSLRDTLCLRRTDHIIKKALRTPILNRDDEVRQLLQILRGESKCTIFRTDIKSYFESVSFSGILSKLQRDGLRNNCALTHLKNLHLLLHSEHKYAGLPRGLALSSTLADYALQEFDRAIFNFDSVIYYTRYVDDICIVHFDKPATLQTHVEKHLPPGLELNTNKTRHLGLPSTDALEFLGYRITLSRPLVVTIANNKLGKTKTRIVLSLKEFLRDNRFDLLVARLRFLSSSVRMKKVGRRQHVCTGYRHVYRHCSTEISQQMKALDTFLHGIINSKRYYLGIRLRKLLSAEQIDRLKRLSFEKSYGSKLTFNVKPQLIAEIKKAWKYG